MRFNLCAKRIEYSKFESDSSFRVHHSSFLLSGADANEYSITGSPSSKWRWIISSQTAGETL